MTSTDTPRPQVLYRFYDATDQLLYIGISVHAPSRFMQHRDDKPWWSNITRITLDHHPDRATVLAAERHAITTERPRHNIVHAAGITTTPTTNNGPAPMFTPGQVIALHIEGERTPPVGEVIHCDHTRITLALYSWASSYFGYTERSYNIGDIRAFRLAQPMTSEDLHVGGYITTPGEIIWNMDPLADFQNAHSQPAQLP